MHRQQGEAPRLRQDARQKRRRSHEGRHGENEGSRLKVSLSKQKRYPYFKSPN